MYKLLIRLFMHLPTEAQSATKTFINKLLRQDNDTAGYRKEKYFGGSSVGFLSTDTFLRQYINSKMYRQNAHEAHMESHE